MIRLLMIAALLQCSLSFARSAEDSLFFVRAKAKDVAARNRIVGAGIAIDGVQSDSVTFVATQKDIDQLDRLSIEFKASPLPQRRGFPSGDSAFHDYQETKAALDNLVKQYPGIVQSIEIGKSLEGRALMGVRLSSSQVPDSLPTSILMGCHHAREHLSVEIPLMAAKYLAENYSTNARIRKLLDTREVWIVPMINPDGAEYDIASGRYKYWRKNRRPNGDGTYGVDLNRNYGKGWGGEGASSSTSSDIYHGPSAFSEPETQAVRDFTRSRKRATTMISFHTFSELVLWPWGHTNSEVANKADREVFQKIGKKMATWNGYRPMKSSGLYVASGDTTDWAYDELGIFAFTFELSPRSMFQGGFYPGASAIQPTFRANVDPILHLLEMTDNPYRSLRQSRDPLGILN